jgi:hypothetical protein
MKLTKRAIAVGAVASVMTLSAAGFVAAAGVQGNGPASVLSSLVDDGTLTQKQANKVEKAMEERREERGAEHQERRAEMGALVSSTLGISEEDLQAARQDGKTLAGIAGDQKDALVAAIADHMTSKINQGVADGKLTETRADEMKENATERATSIVDGKGGPGRGRPGGRGGHRPGQNPGGGETKNSAFSA